MKYATTILMSFLCLVTLEGVFISSEQQAQGANGKREPTFCNPLDLPYSFSAELPSRREAADPTMMMYQGEYWLFASKSEGYWHSKDFIHWQLVVPTGLPIANYAPTTLEIGGKLYWTAFNSKIYVIDDPIKGQWTPVSQGDSHGDPDLFQDTDGRVYLYSGCNNGGPIAGLELDPKNGFKPFTEPITLFHSDIIGHGWEKRPSPTDNASWMEGAWMTKHDGKYYLQYAAPGTDFNTYGDGIYVSDQPLGPFTYAPYSPLSFKPTGFITGAGHSSTFQDFGGRYWHVSTMVLSVRHGFERRLGVFPTWFEADGQMACSTYLGDYPQYAPGVTRDLSKGNSPGWMLLSYRKTATASSTLDKHPLDAAFDENIRTWWSAKTGDPGEWLQVDRGKTSRIDAVQVNFGDEGATQLDRLNDGYGYKLDVSEDAQTWTTIIDRSVEKRDAPHDYTQLDRPGRARYARITNTHSPGGALFSLSGLRLFGSALGHAPNRVDAIQVNRDAVDGRQATINWAPVKDADGYIVRYGIKKDRLFSNYQVYDAHSLHLPALNVGVSYFFTVDSFNASGVTRGTNISKG